MGRQQDHRQGRMSPPDLVEQRQAVAARQSDIAQYQLRPFDVELGEGRFGGRGRAHPVTGGVQAHGYQPQHVGVVIDDEQVRMDLRVGGGNDHVFRGGRAQAQTHRSSATMASCARLRARPLAAR